MGSVSDLLEGIGRGKMDRIVMGKFRMGIDLLEGIRELTQKEGIRTGAIWLPQGSIKLA
jgi:hypothetical protein